MTTPTTFRDDIAAGIETVLTDFRTANPTLLLGVYRARPESFPDLPAAFIDRRSESISHDSGTRTRIMSPSVVIVRRLTNNAEAMAAFDTMVDLLVDAFTAVPQFTSNTIWSSMTIDDEEIDFGESYIFAAVRFSFSNISIMEGRV